MANVLVYIEFEICVKKLTYISTTLNSKEMYLLL